MWTLKRSRRAAPLSAVSLVLVLLAGLTTVRAGGDGDEGGALDEEMAAVAREVARAVKNYGEEAVSIGQFTAPPQLSASAGPGIARLLAEKLKEYELDVRRRADLGVSGEYRLVAETRSGRPAARISGKVEDGSGKTVFTFSHQVKGAATLAALFGSTAELAPEASELAREKQLLVQIERPSVELVKARVAAAPSSPYALEVLVKSGDQYQPRTPSETDGLAFVRIDRDEVYAVRLRNDSDEDAAVTLTIDGINLFAFSGNPDYSYVIVPRKSSGVVKGWYRTRTVSEAFLVTEFPRSAAAELQASPAGIGTITAVFAAAYPKGKTSPDLDREMRFASLRGESLATGRGPAIEASYREVERVVGAVRATVSVRYTRGE